MAVSIYLFRYQRHSVLIELFLFLLLLSNSYFVVTHYSVIPGGDAYWDYKLVQTIIAKHHLPVIPDSHGYIGAVIDRAEHPLIHILCSVLSQICSFQPFYTNFIIPELIWASMFLFLYLFLKIVELNPLLSKMILIFAILAFLTSTFSASPASLTIERQTLAWLFFFIILYITHNIIYKRHSASKNALLIIFAIALVIAHNYTSALMIMYLFLLSITIFIGYVKSELKQHGLSIPTVTLLSTIGVIGFLSQFIWWNSHASGNWLLVEGYLRHMMEVLKTKTFEFETIEFAYRLTPTPEWAVMVLHIRDFILIISTIIGFVIFLRMRIDFKQKYFITCSLIIGATLLLFDALLTWAAPYRIIALFLPFITLCMGTFYDNLLHNSYNTARRQVFKSLLIVIIVLLVFSSLIGFGMHRHTPRHFYDPSVSWLAMGEHPMSWIRLKGFFTEHIVYGELDNVLTDDIYVLSLLMPLDYLNKMYPIVSRRAVLTDKTMIVAFRGLRPQSYIPQGMPWEYNPYFDEFNFRHNVVSNYRLIYNDGEYMIWH
ncbi:MAG: hypothetical protein ACTSV7_03885 [Candidatus Baldrarchaeia archaeon]